jgi:hypothetical protein
MATGVVTVTSGGMPVVDVTASNPKLGMAVTESLNGRGMPVTKGNSGIPVTYIVVSTTGSHPK